MAGMDYKMLEEVCDEKKALLAGRLSKLSKKTRALCTSRIGIYDDSVKQMEQCVQKLSMDFRNGRYQTPSTIFTKDYKDAMDAMVPPAYQSSFLNIIDRLNQFQYSYGWQRRSVRSTSYLPWISMIPEILNQYADMWLFSDMTLAQLLTLDSGSEKYLLYLRQNVFNNMGLLLAGELDRKSPGVVEAVHDILCGENNTAVLSVGLIQGIIKSKNTELHKLLGDLLLAAKLQEGVRQAICENMDCGTTDAFLTLFDVIEKHGLIRYSSVRRAVCTWIGIFGYEHVDRLTDKMLALMSAALRDPAVRKEQIKSEDTVSITCGLWATGFYDVSEAVAIIQSILESGTRHQKLTSSYYTSMLDFSNLEEMAASKALLSEYKDLELAACFLPSFLSSLTDNVSALFQAPYDTIQIPKPCSVTEYFSDIEEAKKFFEILESILHSIQKKELIFSPCIFPWHSVCLKKSDVAVKICLIAYLIGEDSYLDRACDTIGDINTTSYYLSRSRIINLLLYHPVNSHQQSILIHFIDNAETATAKTAYEIAATLTFTDDDWKQLEPMMKSKRGEIRTRVEQLLLKQDDSRLENTLSRLLNSSKEEYRLGALDMILHLKTLPEKTAFFQKACKMTASLSDCTGKEKILLNEIQGSQERLSQKGFGIYTHAQTPELKKVSYDKRAVNQYLNLTEQSIIDILKKLDNLIDENRMTEYKDYDGETCLIGNEIRSIKKGNAYPSTLEQLPLEQTFRNFYTSTVKNFETMIQIEVYLNCLSRVRDYRKGENVLLSLFGRTIWMKMPYELTDFPMRHFNQVTIVLDAMQNSYMDRKTAFDMAVNLTAALLHLLTPDNCLLSDDDNGSYYQHMNRITNHPAIVIFYQNLKNWETETEFEKAFYLMWAMEEIFAAADAKKHDAAAIPQTAKYGINPDLPLHYFFQASAYNLISENQLYQAVFEYYDLPIMVSAISAARKNKMLGGKIDSSLWNQMFDDHTPILTDPRFLQMDRCYDTLIPLILKTEMTRGDRATLFSSAARSIQYICGADIFVKLLTALGKEVFDRDSYYYYFYYYSNDHLITKKSSMSHLIKVCYPAAGENGQTLKRLLSGSDITKKRLVEAAMFAPQWIPLIEEYLGFHGLKSGCYYFMAHMNEHFDDQTKAIIAKYTPLSTEDLQKGAFDVHWFWEAYGQLGEKRFKELYDASKYISSGSAHTRARKYADAALSNISLLSLASEISLKRNKDLLMSYGIAPLDQKDKDKDLMERYQFLQQFLKESKQFGAARRASESAAVSMSLQNLSINAGYPDVTRLILNIETKLSESFLDCFTWKISGNTSYKIAVDEKGNASIQAQKNGKLLKSIPAKDKKDEYVLMLTGIKKKMKEQFSRTKKMMEEAMEDRTSFTAGEIYLLGKNPVTAPIVTNLVFLCNEKMGFLSDGVLTGTDESKTVVSEQEEVCLAHPVDFYQKGNWHEFQTYLFTHKIVQPLKQIFRELYVKLEEELPKKHSLMFAGNQIQPRKTVAVLKNRRWIADYEDGLQKVFYKENIIARIYALADWFSPADIEAPTLEWVEFSDRKDFHSLAINEIPDLIYSEVMRDVDLAVSTAHVGGVDPETSHSTVQMRAAIIEFNLPLFQLSNVSIDGSHALIKGTKGEYTVHLGSGIIHQFGGTMISVHPVHSQKRGRLFLPFVDDDPKTAEIMSKIILFAEDQKIKDPYILRQIH